MIRPLLRGILAVLAGIIVLTIVSFGIEAAVGPWITGHLPQVWARLIMLAYTMLSVAAGGYVTAWLALRSRLLHAVIMGALEAAMTAWVVVKLPGHGGPLWPGIAAIVLIIPAAWSGAMIYARQARPLRVPTDLVLRDRAESPTP
jgi:hypothetical protein